MQRVRRQRSNEKVIRIRRPKNLKSKSNNAILEHAKRGPDDLQNLIQLTPDDLKRILKSKKAEKPTADVNKGSAENFRNFYEKELRRNLGEPDEKGWVPNVICPFHDDSNPSFAINLFSGAFRCFGCDAKGNAAKFYQIKHDLDYQKASSELFDNYSLKSSSKKNEKPRPLGKVLSIYDYLDLDRDLKMRVCRYEGKQFRQFSPDGSGGFVPNIKGVELIPYNLPGVVNAETVYIVEGEKDADNLAKLDLTASCNPMGAGKWKPTYNQHFEGKQIIILPDNDRQGRSHALKVAHSLHGTAKSIKIVQLLGFPDKGDVSDWLEAGNSKEKLLAESAKAPLWSPDKNLETSEPSLSIISINDLLAMNYEDLLAVIGDGILPEGGGLIVAGESEIGKSLITMEWAIQLAIGKNLIDGKIPVPKSRKVIFFQSEIPFQLLQERIKRILRGMGNPSLQDRIFFADPKCQYNLRDSSCVENIIAAVVEHEADVFILDPLSSFHTVNENDNTLMRNVLDQVTHISRQTGAAAIVAHHFGKPVKDRDESYRLRGAIAIKDWCDTLITLTGKKHENKTLLWLKFEKIRHGKKPRPILLERDEQTFIHKVTEEDTVVTPKQIQELLVNQFNGRVDKQKDLVEAATEKYKCTDRTVRTAIKEAVNQKLIKKYKSGRECNIVAI